MQSLQQAQRRDCQGATAGVVDYTSDTVDTQHSACCVSAPDLAQLVPNADNAAFFVHGNNCLSCIGSVRVVRKPADVAASRVVPKAHC